MSVLLPKPLKAPWHMCKLTCIYQKQDFSAASGLDQTIRAVSDRISSGCVPTAQAGSMQKRNKGESKKRVVLEAKKDCPAQGAKDPKKHH